MGVSADGRTPGIRTRMGSKGAVTTGCAGSVGRGRVDGSSAVNLVVRFFSIGGSDARASGIDVSWLTTDAKTVGTLG